MARYRFNRKRPILTKSEAMMADALIEVSAKFTYMDFEFVLSRDVLSKGHPIRVYHQYRIEKGPMVYHGYSDVRTRLEIDHNYYLFITGPAKVCEYPHRILAAEAGAWTPRDDTFEFLPYSDVMAWINESVKQGFTRLHWFFCFKDEDEALMFKLRWL